MTHFGIVSPPVSGHLHPFAALGRELIARGHRVTVFHMADIERKIRSEGLDFIQVGSSDHPLGSLPASLAALGRLEGTAAIHFTVKAVAKTSEMFCRDLPDAVRRERVDALLVDQMEPAGGSVAEKLDLPFVTICNALAINRDRVVPPPFTPWAYRDTAWAALRNKVGYTISDRMTRPIASVVAAARARWRLRPHATPDESFSRLAQISQMAREFDFPRRRLPESFHYTGPLRGALPAAVSFPWERLDGRPFIYASLGTLQNSREPLFRLFAEACQGLGVQLVLSHGGGLTREEAERLPGDPLVVGYAPQWELLAKASLTLTHAGLNTVLDSLAHGAPLVVVPITYEQPAIARRVEWTGTGRSLPMRTLTAKALRAAIALVLEQERYRTAARQMQLAIKRAGGVSRAASIVEDALGLRRAQPQSVAVAASM